MRVFTKLFCSVLTFHGSLELTNFNSVYTPVRHLDVIVSFWGFGWLLRNVIARNDLSIKCRSKYSQMLFLTPPMTFTGVWPRTYGLQANTPALLYIAVWFVFLIIKSKWVWLESTKSFATDDISKVKIYVFDIFSPGYVTWFERYSVFELWTKTPFTNRLSTLDK